MKSQLLPFSNILVTFFLTHFAPSLSQYFISRQYVYWSNNSIQLTSKFLSRVMHYCTNKTLIVSELLKHTSLLTSRYIYPLYVCICTGTVSMVCFYAGIFSIDKEKQLLVVAAKYVCMSNLLYGVCI